MKNDFRTCVFFGYLMYSVYCLTMQMDKKRRRSATDESAADANVTVDQRVEHRETDASVQEPEVVLVEPFYGGSHKQLVVMLVEELLMPRGVRHAVCSLPPRKWHWRLMAASMYFADTIPRSRALRVLFVTSMVNLCELLGLRPDLSDSRVRKIYYFHENQLTYPFQTATAGSEEELKARKVAAEDFQVGWSQIISCLAADELLFNSDFNRTSFLNKVDAFVNKIPEPEMRHRGLAAQLRAKSRVLYFPLTIPPIPAVEKTATELTILWNHRWEYDKDPDEFFQTLLELARGGARFQVVVLGEAFGTSPAVFATAKETLEAAENVTIVHWGYAESKSQYFELLHKSDVVVSTSLHEFFGVAMLEAVLCGCYPLVPNRLVYPELFSGATVYNTQRQLFKKLKYFCRNPFAARKFYAEQGRDFEKYTWKEMKVQYEATLLGWKDVSEESTPPSGRS